VPCRTAEWHPGELYPRVGFVTKLPRPAEQVVAFYNQSEQFHAHAGNAQGGGIVVAD
jgi:hypothetical protein